MYLTEEPEYIDLCYLERCQDHVGNTYWYKCTN